MNKQKIIWRPGRWSIGSGPRFGKDSQWFQVQSCDGDPIQGKNDFPTGLEKSLNGRRSNAVVDGLCSRKLHDLNYLVHLTVFVCAFMVGDGCGVGQLMEDRRTPQTQRCCLVIPDSNDDRNGGNDDWGSNCN